MTQIEIDEAAQRAGERPVPTVTLLASASDDA